MATPLPRLDSVDLLRGVVIMIMALDHVRDFFSDRLPLYDPTDLDKATPALFLTRWITHYCAPTFVFLAGVGAFLSGIRGKSKGQLAWFLLTRGLWLALLEVTLIRALWMFNFDIYEHGAGVFWPLGWGMVILAGLIYLPMPVIAIFGLVMVAFHNLLDGLTSAQMGIPNLLWVILHSGGKGVIMQGENYQVTFETGYCLIPWAGVMALGYCFGPLLLLGPVRRRRVIFRIGLMMTLGFIALRAANVYGDASPWAVQPTFIMTVISFLNCTKYPPSLLYLLMTLGPAIMALALFDQVRGKFVQPIITFGRVPLFFYLLHILLIHGGAVALDYARFGWSPLADSGPWDLASKIVPLQFGVSLPMIYLVWVMLLIIIYPPCRWFAGVKQRHRNLWLSYL
ncbi:MAG TPA: heparan-alpha-glucosaminide N-acetyltransferase domain-containing protein [Gemmatales bacterium]|nr:heparan-alpha-glucosaminide N-acetyltransferase domain-containing protein [Gemmatales bacterium]